MIRNDGSDNDGDGSGDSDGDGNGDWGLAIKAEESAGDSVIMRTET